MNRAPIIVAAALGLLLAVQTWRLHALQRKHADNFASAVQTREEAPVNDRLAASPEVDAVGPAKGGALSGKNSDAGSADGIDANVKPSVPGANVVEKQDAAPVARKPGPKADAAAAPANQLPAMLRKSLSQANKAFADGDYETALKLMEDAVKAFPQEGQAYASLAKLYSDLGMTDEAIKAYRDWTSARPDDARAFLGAAGLYESLGMNDDALDDLAQYERLKDGAPDSYAAAASMYRRLGMPEQELNALTNWVDTAPTSPQAYLALGEYYRRNGDPASALAQYQQASTLAPGNVTAHSSLALAYQQLGQYPNAQAELLTAIALHPGDTGLQMRLADVYRRGGDLNSAIATYQNVIQQEPNSGLALRASQQIARLQQQIKAPVRKN